MIKTPCSADDEQGNESKSPTPPASPKSGAGLQGENTVSEAIEVSESGPSIEMATGQNWSSDAAAAMMRGYQLSGAAELADKLAQQAIDTSSIFADQSASVQAAISALMGPISTLPTVNLGINTAAMLEQLHLNVATNFYPTELNDWSTALRHSLKTRTSPRPRKRRTTEDFFSAFEAEVDSLPKLLRALSVMQQKNSHFGLVWRGQQNARWPIDSSLTRNLREGGYEVGEKALITVERFQALTAEGWGIPRAISDLNFYAELQHEGAPTRLIDVSLDPEIAVWFAVQASDEHEETDARLLCWGRSAAAKRNGKIQPPPSVPNDESAFWQHWEDEETRRANEWGTGRTVRSWRPAMMNTRMRAQRAAFLFDAEPTIDSTLLNLFADQLGGDWRADEIAEATRVVGFPSPHHKRATWNSESIVPMFTIRIAARAKEKIRAYLGSKGLTEQSIYPDRAGLISYLRRTSAQESRQSRIEPLA